MALSLTEQEDTYSAVCQGFIGSGICGDLLEPGESGCVGNGQYYTGTQFCWDNDATPSVTAGLTCVQGTCRYYCDWETNTGSSLQCPESESCGETLQPTLDYQDLSFCMEPCPSGEHDGGGGASSNKSCPKFSRKPFWRYLRRRNIRAIGGCVKSS